VLARLHAEINKLLAETEHGADSTPRGLEAYITTAAESPP